MVRTILAFWRKMSQVIINIFSGCEPPKPKILPFLFATGDDEKIVKEAMNVPLSKPIRPGFRRAFSVSTDEPVDMQPNGAFARSENVEGDSTPAVISPESTATLIKGWIYGDGSIGSKKTRVIVDAHVGEGEVSLALDISYDVASPDATSFEGFTEGADEAIPS